MIDREQMVNELIEYDINETNRACREAFERIDSYARKTDVQIAELYRQMTGGLYAVDNADKVH